MESLQPLLGKQVIVVTLEGRCLVGTLKGFDSVCNLVLENAFERTFHLDKGMQLEPMGLYLVRGDSLCVLHALCAASIRACCGPGLHGQRAQLTPLALLRFTSLRRPLQRPSPPPSPHPRTRAWPPWQWPSR